MTEVQKKKAEEIIHFVKTNNNKVFRETLHTKFNFDSIEKAFILSTLIEELNLLKIKGELCFLTKKGCSFVSFTEMESATALKTEKFKIDLKLNKWLLKTKWLPIFIAFISFLFTVYVYFNSKNDLKTLEMRIKNLELIILNQKRE